MGTIAGILASFAASHLGGSVLGGLFASQGWLGFAKGAGKIVAKRRAKRAQQDLQNWLDKEDGE